MDFDSITWAGAEGELDNHPFLLRFREMPDTFPKVRYPQRINIFWAMSDPDKNGLPSDEEFTRLEVFEDRLVEAVESDQQSILLGAITCNGEKEFIFHTANVPEFMQPLTNMPQEQERYPITILRYDDADWSYFNTIVSNAV